MIERFRSDPRTLNRSVQDGHATARAIRTLRLVRRARPNVVLDDVDSLAHGVRRWLDGEMCECFYEVSPPWR